MSSKSKSKHNPPKEILPENDEIVYEVEEILYHREVAQTRQYFVKWVGYPESENSWINEDDMSCFALLQDYMEKIKKKQFVSKNLFNIREFTTIGDLTKKGREIKSIKEGEKNIDGVFYTVVLDDGTLALIHSADLTKHNPKLIIDYLETKINFI